MIRNYLKIAIRSITRHRLITSINLFGLTLGLTSCLLILTYVLNELSYDKHFPENDKTYRISRTFKNSDGAENLHLGALAPPFGPALKQDFPEIKDMTRLLGNGNTAIRYKDDIFSEEEVFFADSSFFNFFNAGMIHGNSRNALQEPYSIVLAEDVAEKYFGTTNPVNEMLRVDNQNAFKVTGVFKSFPDNSHFHPKVLLSFESLNDSAIYGRQQLATNWGNNSFFTYVKLDSDADAEKLTRLFPSFIDKHMGPLVPATVQMSKFTSLHVQRLPDIHLYSHLDSELESNGDIRKVYLLSCIALFILLIACINYMNLSTARSVLRSKEIGIRKAIGAQKSELIRQFLSESVLVTSFALLMALILLIPAIHIINSVSGQSLTIATLNNPWVVLSILLMPVVVGIISGLYPALFMSGFNTVRTLKGVFRVESKGVSLRKALVVFQFAVSIILIVSTIVVFKQLDYMQNSELGFDKDRMISVNYPPSLNPRYESFRTELLQGKGITGMCRSSRIPTGRLLDDLGTISIVSGDSVAKGSTSGVKFVSIDHDFLTTYNIKLVAGRNYSRDFSLDSNNFILNEAAVKDMSWPTPESAIGRTIRYGGITGQVIGVTKDFHFESMHENIVPLLFLISRNTSAYDNLSVKTTNIKVALDEMQQEWNAFFPETPFSYQLLDDNVRQLYESEIQQSLMFTTFSSIAIIIACLGLFGLSAFSISRRIKEIGIRKVLGARISEIVTLLSADFLRLVVIATFIGLPAAWYFMNAWLSDFAFRINIPAWALVISPLAAMLLAMVTISSLAFRAATTNPTENLRTE